MVAQPVVAEVHHLAARLATIGSATAVSVLLVGDRPYSVADVAEAVGANPLGTLPADGRSAAALAGGHLNTARTLRRSGLLRDAGAIAAGLADWLGPAPGAPAAIDPSVGPPVPTPMAPPRPPGPGAAGAAAPVRGAVAGRTPAGFSSAARHAPSDAAAPAGASARPGGPAGRPRSAAARRGRGPAGRSDRGSMGQRRRPGGPPPRQRAP